MGRCRPGSGIGSVVISEVMANPAVGQPDWIELHNTTSQPMDIGGWFLSDDKEDLTRYRITQGTTISPGGYVVFYEDRHFANRSDPGCASPFGLSAAGETVVLTSGQAGVVTGCSDEMSFGPSDSSVSLGRWTDPDGIADGMALTSATPGQANAPVAVGPVVISEVFARPDAIPEAEYVELFNSGSQTVTLYDSHSGRPWRLVVEEGNSQPVVLDLPANPGLSLGPRGCTCSPRAGRCLSSASRAWAPACLSSSGVRAACPIRLPWFGCSGPCRWLMARSSGSRRTPCPTVRPLQASHGSDWLPPPSASTH